MDLFIYHESAPFMSICYFNFLARYIAKTLYGDEEEVETPQNNNVEEPKLLGLNPGSDEKVEFVLCIS